MLHNDKNLDELIITWVSDGSLPEGVTLEQLSKYYMALSSEQKRKINNRIELQLPMCDWAYIAPLLQSLPKHLFYGVAIAIVSAVAMECYSSKSSMLTDFAVGSIAGVATFFGLGQHKKNQINVMWSAIKNRANVFLESTDQSQENIRDEMFFAN